MDWISASLLPVSCAYSRMSPLLLHQHAPRLTHTLFDSPLSVSGICGVTHCLVPSSGFPLPPCLSRLSLTNTGCWFGCVRTLHWDPDPSTLQLHSDSELIGYCFSSLVSLFSVVVVSCKRCVILFVYIIIYVSTCTLSLPYFHLGTWKLWILDLPVNFTRWVGVCVDVER